MYMELAAEAATDLTLSVTDTPAPVTDTVFSISSMVCKTTTRRQTVTCSDLCICTYSCWQASHQQIICVRQASICHSLSCLLLLLHISSPSRWSEQQWLQGWAVMAQRYANVSAVVGVGLRNEPRPTFVSELLAAMRPAPIG
jgi:hypothetical protein